MYFSAELKEKTITEKRWFYTSLFVYVCIKEYLSLEMVDSSNKNISRATFLWIKIKNKKIRSHQSPLQPFFLKTKNMFISEHKSYLVVGIAGLEPATKRLWVFCSNQLSYMPRSNLSNSLYRLIQNNGGWYRTWTYDPLLVRQML